MRFQVIPVEKIVPDPDVQFEWSFNERLARTMAANYDPQAAGVIDVCPLSGDDEHYGVFVGRHRHWAAVAAGVKTMRCDVWEGLTPADKHRIKLMKDRDRRTTRRVELFLNEVGAGEITAIEILEIVEARGYTIGPLAGGKPYDRIEAVGTLEGIHVYNENLDEALAFGDIWKGDPKTNTGKWLAALSEAVRQGWTSRVTATGVKHLQDLIPAKALRQAEGEATMVTISRGVNREVTFLLADLMRRKARVRRAPVDQPTTLHAVGE